MKVINRFRFGAPIDRIRDTREVYTGSGTIELTPDKKRGVNAYKYFKLTKMESSRDMGMQKNVGQKSQPRTYFHHLRPLKNRYIFDSHIYI